MRDAATALTALGAAACWYFVAAYWWLSRGACWKTAAGRHMQLLTGSLGALLTFIFTARVWPTFPGRPVVTIALYGLVVVQLVWRCVLLHRAQHD